MADTIKFGETYENVINKINRLITEFNEAGFEEADGNVTADNNFKDGEILIADGNGKKAKSSGFKVSNDTNNMGGNSVALTEIPTKEAIAQYLNAYVKPIAISFRDCTPDFENGTLTYIVSQRDTPNKYNIYNNRYIVLVTDGKSGGAPMVCETSITHSGATNQMTLTIVIKVAPEKLTNELIALGYAVLEQWVYYDGLQ